MNTFHFFPKKKTTHTHARARTHTSTRTRTQTHAHTHTLSPPSVLFRTANALHCRLIVSSAVRTVLQRPQKRYGGDFSLLDVPLLQSGVNNHCFILRFLALRQSGDTAVSFHSNSSLNLHLFVIFLSHLSTRQHISP